MPKAILIKKRAKHTATPNSTLVSKSFGFAQKDMMRLRSGEQSTRRNGIRPDTKKSKPLRFAPFLH
jgi:hypothetical protein